VATLTPRHGHLAILGVPRSGRTTAALTVAAAAISAGLQTHVMTHQIASFAHLRSSGWLGSVMEPSAASFGAWLESLDRNATGQRVVVVDTAEPLAEVIPAGQSRTAIEVLAAMGPDWLVVITAGSRPARYLSHFPQRIVLPTTDLTDDLALGLDRAMAGGRINPGRAVLTRPGVCAHLQIGQVSQPPAVSAPPALAPPSRILSLPTKVGIRDLPPASKDRLWWGLGGKLALPLALDLAPGRPVAVLGPPGSGRTTVLNALADQGRRAGLEVISDLPPNPWPAITRGLERGALVVADNLDQAVDCPAVLPRQGHLVAALTTDVSPSFRGPAVLLQNPASALVLWPNGPSAAAALGLTLPIATDHGSIPGRGLALRAGRFISLQAISP